MLKFWKSKVACYEFWIEFTKRFLVAGKEYETKL